MMLESMIYRMLAFLSLAPSFSSQVVHYGSMEPVLHHGDYLFSEQLPGVEQRAQRGDIVLVKRPYDFLDNRPVVKRLAALPGDDVQWLGRTMRLKDREYWVLGEQQPLSEDSLDFGPVHGIYKRVIGVYCPHQKRLRMELGKKAD